MRPERFELHVPDADVIELRDRLRRTRWPDQTPGPDQWRFGAPVPTMRDLAGYWADGFDWRRQEADLNRFEQYRVELRGVPVHFLHVVGRGPDPMPLLLLHGWPGSVFEFLDMIPRLTDPARFGGNPADAVTVVAPSLPGFGLSFRPGQPRMGVTGIAETLTELMTDVLAYDRFGLQGGDWGAHISTKIAVIRPERLIGLHLNFLPLAPSEPLPEHPTAAEVAFDEERREWARTGTGYSAIQGTRPQTLAFGLTDSPAGLAAWIGEKFMAWTDNDGSYASAVPVDRMLGNISLYWYTGAIGSSFYPYFAQRLGDRPLTGDVTVDVPFGYASFPKEIRHPPRSVVERRYTDIRRWTEMPRGGHFAAMEQPEALAYEITAFYRPLRARSDRQ